jgi:peptidoglycan/xylan/chitin deacetylase (PgdA/CDA1 family)
VSTQGQAPAGSKQQKLAAAIVRSGLLNALRRLHDRGRIPLVILAYHRIAAIGRPQDYPLDPGLVSATMQEFDAQMCALREFANVVSLDQVADAVTHGRALPARAVAVTFDDGFSDTFELAFPLLQRHGIPATVFVSTEHVESDEPYWFELAAHLMLRVPARAIAFEECPAGLPAADDSAARRAAIVHVHQLLKRCPEPRRRRLLDEWRRRFAGHLEARALELCRPISRAQILQMAAAGIQFGSHTVSHPNLALAPDDLIDAELRQSREYLARLLGRPIRSLAYPFGTPDSYDERVKSAARASGYELAVSFRQGVNWTGTLDALELRRVGISPGMSAAQFRAMLALPSWIHPRLRDTEH